MTKIAFLGLGSMGAPMAMRLRSAGHDLSVWNRSPAKAAPLQAGGARVATSPADAARDAEAVFTMLADPASLDAVLFGTGGTGGAAGAMRAGSVWIDCSTTGPDAFRDLAARLPVGLTAIDAPVLGSVPQATDGSLQIFVGATPEVLTRWSSLLGALGRPISAGPMGAGAALKLVANSTLGALMTALGEALALADAFQLDTKAVLDVLENSPIGITTRAKRELVESGAYPARFRLALAAKDMRLVNAAAATRHVDLRVARAAHDWLEAAAAAKLGDLDYSAVIAHIRGRAAH